MDKRPIILVVDDEPINLQFISTGLGGEYDIVTVQNGFEAINQVKSSPPDLILLDVMMPDINGFDVCKLIKANPSYEDIPVVFLTALDTQEGALQGLDFGGIDYLTKPVNLPQLKLRVRNHIVSKQRNDIVKEQRNLLEQKNNELEKALARVKQLEGVIPICSYCKNIRDDKSSWQQLEQYISDHSEAIFSHGICPDCLEKQMEILNKLS